MLKKLAILLCLVSAGFLPSAGAGETLPAAADSIRVTLLTCSPGQEVYSLYGHTAIRCQTQPPSISPLEGKIDPSQPPLKGEERKSPFKGDSEGLGDSEESFDLVFNYGVFDMTKPHFAWHFVLGQTDYMVQPIPWKYFVREYEASGRSITEQELNLTRAEARRLLSRLLENCLPENRSYRYNFLYGNCTTKVRDMVEGAVRGDILYPDTLLHETFREILHHYTADHPWAQEGNDLLLGAEVDTILSVRASLFVPENLMRAFDGAFVCAPNGDLRQLVRKKTVLLEAKPQAAEPEFPLLPWQALLAFAALCLLVMALEAWLKRLFWLWDVLLLLAVGTAGTLLTFMFLFSQHPAVGTNWQVWLLNPVALVGIPLVIKSAIRHRPTLWYAFQFTVLALFLLFSPWIPQVFAKITVPLALCLLTRPISYYKLRIKS